MTGVAHRHTGIGALVSQEAVVVYTYTSRTREGKVEREARGSEFQASLGYFTGRGNGNNTFLSYRRID